MSCGILRPAIVAVVYDEDALESGFHNLSNFNEQFLQIKGLTPRAYRQKAKQGLVSKRA